MQASITLYSVLIRVIAVIGDAYTDRITVASNAVIPVQQSARVQTSNSDNNDSKQHYHLRQRRRLQSSASSVNVLSTVQHIQGLQRADTVSTLLLSGDVLLGTTADTSTNGLTIETGIKGHTSLPIAALLYYIQ
jgi:hypothetical protein